VPTDDLPSAVRDGVVVAHASTLNGLVGDELDRLLASLAQQNLYLVVVSGGFSRSVADSERVYRRKTPVAGARTPDDGFRRCFADFWEDYRTSHSPEFALLEPAATPGLDRLETLCAGYVLAVIGDPGKETPPEKLTLAVAALGLDPVGRATDAVRAKLAGYRAWFETTES